MHMVHVVWVYSNECVQYITVLKLKTQNYIEKADMALR